MHLNAKGARDILEALGWKVGTCADGAEAMKMLAGDDSLCTFAPGESLAKRSETDAEVPTQEERPPWAAAVKR